MGKTLCLERGHDGGCWARGGSPRPSLQLFLLPACLRPGFSHVSSWEMAVSHIHTRNVYACGHAHRKKIQNPILN